MPVSRDLSDPVHRGDHIRGPIDASLVLVEYMDFQCPHCRRASAIVWNVAERWKGQLAVVVRHFPIVALHPDSQRAAEAAEAAAAQGGFWAFHDLLFAHERALDATSLIGYAGDLGLDSERFAAELAAGAHAGRVEHDLRAGVASGVHATPTFFVNGRRHEGSWEVPDLHLALLGVARELGLER